MSMDVGTLLERYARFLTLGGLVAAAAVLAVRPALASSSRSP